VDRLNGKTNEVRRTQRDEEKGCGERNNWMRGKETEENVRKGWIWLGCPTFPHIFLSLFSSHPTSPLPTSFLLISMSSSYLIGFTI